MTELQIQKSEWLRRLYFSKLKVDSLQSLKKYDRQHLEDINKELLEKTCEDTYEKCVSIIKTISVRSEENWLKAFKEYNEIRLQIENAIDSIENSEYQYVLRARYIEDKTWRQIAVEMFFSERNVKYLHVKALDEIEITLS